MRIFVATTYTKKEIGLVPTCQPSGQSEAMHDGIYWRASDPISYMVHFDRWLYSENQYTIKTGPNTTTQHSRWIAYSL